jgi:hypothetical protein
MKRLAEENQFLKAGRFVLRYDFIQDIDIDQFFWGLIEARKTEMAMRFLVAKKDEKVNRQFINELTKKKANWKFAHEIVRRFRYRLYEFPELSKALYTEANAHYISRWQKGPESEDFISLRALEEVFL